MKNLTTNALKHATKDRLAVVTTPTVYFSDLEGLINHHFPNKQFNSQPYTKVVPFPGDFEEAKNTYFAKLEEKRKVKEAERRTAAEAEYQKRRDNILGLRRWRCGETECYVVSSYKWVTDDSLNWDKEDYECKLFFDLDKANEYFDEVYKENEDFCEPGYRFYVELTQIQDCEKGETVDIPISDRLKITSVDDICETYMQHSFAGGLRQESIEQELPEDAVIVTYRKGEWTYIQRAAQNTWTGNLRVDRGEYHEKDEVYRLSELNTHNDYHLLTDIIKRLDLTRKDCEQYLSESDLDELFDEDE